VSSWSEEDVTALLAELGSHGVGGINPSEEQLRTLLSTDVGGPLQFVNLLSYHSEAQYPAGHDLAEAGLSGAEAYGRYGERALDHAARRGGVFTLYNDVLQVLIGQTGPWDQIAVMQYPGTETFVDMIRDPDYQVGLVDRDAGLAQTAILVSRPLL
jgi:uncharacterized protein (DUF1330 family)